MNFYNFSKILTYSQLFYAFIKLAAIDTVSDFLRCKRYTSSIQPLKQIKANSKVTSIVQNGNPNWSC